MRRYAKGSSVVSKVFRHAQNKNDAHFFVPQVPRNYVLSLFLVRLKFLLLSSENGAKKTNRCFNRTLYLSGSNVFSPSSFNI